MRIEILYILHYSHLPTPNNGTKSRGMIPFHKFDTQRENVLLPPSCPIKSAQFNVKQVATGVDRYKRTLRQITLRRTLLSLQTV